MFDRDDVWRRTTCTADTQGTTPDVGFEFCGRGDELRRCVGAARSRFDMVWWVETLFVPRTVRVVVSCVEYRRFKGRPGSGIALLADVAGWAIR